MASAAQLIQAMGQQMGNQIVVPVAPNFEMQFVRENRNLNNVHKVSRPNGAFVLPMPIILEFMDQIQAQRDWWLTQPIRIATVAG
ncbi:MAG: hypothetical protein HC802_05480 [Caldilineaceae bacterium]|nr:hypothetical protein [Caldilineaceae bacterium]